MKKLLALTVFGFSAAALAQGSAPAFEDVDANQDGSISREEAAIVEGLDFDMADVNQDGALSREEYTEATQ